MKAGGAAKRRCEGVLFGWKEKGMRLVFGVLVLFFLVGVVLMVLFVVQFLMMLWFFLWIGWIVEMLGLWLIEEA